MRKQHGCLEFIPNSEPVTILTGDVALKPIQPNTLTIGDPENYLSDVITANITVASSCVDKEIIGDVDGEFEKITLPKPKKYRRKIGRGGEEIDFLAEEIPETFRRKRGYDLKMLIAFLAWKVMKLEEELRVKWK